jgi:hypothetical protein
MMLRWVSIGVMEAERSFSKVGTTALLDTLGFLLAATAAKQHSVVLAAKKAA